MKEFVDRARMITGNVADAIRRAVNPPLGDDARPIDVRRAIVEAIEQQAEPAGAGRRVLSGDMVDLKLLAEQPEARRTLEAVLDGLNDAVVHRLREVQCEIPPRFTVKVSYLRKLPNGWTPGQRFAIQMKHRDQRSADEQPTPPTVNITVLKGEAEQQSYSFTEAMIRIGRTAEPSDDRGRPRFNHLAFVEGGPPENSTVGRGHAHIRYNAAINEHRLFDEGSHNGTRLIRDGEVIDLPKRDPVGVVLQSDDEVQFGRTSIRVRIVAADGQLQS